MSKHNEEKGLPQTEEEIKTGEATSENLDGGKDAEDAVGVKKNIVGPNHDELPADNSPTTGDVTDDAEENIRNARNEGFRNGQREAEEAGREVPQHPEEL